MGTLIEEIFARKAGRPVQAGEILLLDVDYIMSHDNTTPLAIKAFREIGKPIMDKNKIVLHLDHAYPAPIAAADAVLYPDVFVTRDSRDKAREAALAKAHPALIAEVLSDSTAAYDRGRKFEIYQKIPELQEYAHRAGPPACGSLSQERGRPLGPAPGGSRRYDRTDQRRPPVAARRSVCGRRIDTAA